MDQFESTLGSAVLHAALSRVSTWRTFLFASIVLAVAAANARAAEPVTVDAQVDSAAVALGQRIRLQIVVRGSDTPVQPELTSIPHCTTEFLGGGSNNSSTTIIINGRTRIEESKGYVFNWSVTPTQAGNFTIPAIPVKIGDETISTRPLTIRVSPPQEDPDLKVRIEIDPPTPYVGEPTTLRVTLLLLRNLDDVDLAFRGVEPAFSVPRLERSSTSMRQLALNVLGEGVPAQSGSEVIEGVRYSTFVAERQIIPVRAGEGEIAATLAGGIVVRTGDGFFDAGERRRVSVPSNAAKFTVRELPAQGRPAGFNNLVGTFTISAQADPVAVNVGDPVTLRITVNGQGPMDRVPKPDLKRLLGQDNFRVPDDMASPELRTGQIVFTQTVRPVTDQIKEIPPIELPYFDTKSGRYAVAKSGAIPIRVAATRVLTATDAVAGSPDAVQAPELRERAGGIAANIESASILADQRFDLVSTARGPVVVAAVAAPPAIFLTAWAVLAARRRATVDSERSRARGALPAARRALEGSDTQASAVTRAVSVYVADRFGFNAAALTASECERQLAQIDQSKAADVREILDRCDAAKYAGLPAGEVGDLKRRVMELLEALDSTHARAGASR